MVLTPYYDDWIPAVPTVPMDPTPPIPCTLFCCPPNCLMVLGRLESLPETLGLFPLSLIMPPLIPMIAF